MSQDQSKTVLVVSFGYKNGGAPAANLLIDVRFLKNPFWVEELRPLTGREKPVRDYVVEQSEAQELLANAMRLVSPVIPAMFGAKSDTFTVAFGCTGGQHRSVAMAEAFCERLKNQFPDYQISVKHRELEKMQVAGIKE